MSSGKVGVNRGVFICKNIYNRYSDLDAKQFMYASGISNNQIKDAIYRLCIDLKMAGIFTKCTAIYPFVGGTATTHRFNLRDPRDLNAAFRLQFFGGGTHSANGYQPNGTNGYADTFLVPSTSQSLNSNGMGCYIGTNLSELQSEPVNMGAFNSVTQASSMAVNNTVFGGRMNGTSLSVANTDKRGFYSAQKTSATQTDFYKNGVSVVGGNSGGTLSGFSIYLGTLNLSGSPYSLAYVRNDFRFAFISSGLTAFENLNLYTIVNNFQVTLNRNV
jgi:hypothetical protein